MTPVEVFDRLITGIGEHRWHELADLYAEDAVAHIPLMVPVRGRVNGREEIRAHFAEAAKGSLVLRPHNIVVHTTGDPEVIIAEFDYDARDTATGRVSTMANVQVLRIRDGLILLSRDYHDHLRLAALVGRATALAAAMD
jgi:uncharacterized protein